MNSYTSFTLPAVPLPVLICNMNTTFCAGCPDSMNITMPGSPYTAGDELTCTSDGYPAATYSWTVGTSQGSTTSTQVLLEGEHDYVCTATVTYDSTTCSDTLTVTAVTVSYTHLTLPTKRIV